MVRALLWFRCAAVHDPVRPIQTRPAGVGWAAKFRSVDLEIERSFKGDELLRRMKGWITVEPEDVIEIIATLGRLRVLDDRDLVVECRSQADLDQLRARLKERFADQIDLEA